LWTFWTSRREVPPTGKIRPYFAKRRALPHNSGFLLKFTVFDEFFQESTKGLPKKAGPEIACRPPPNQLE
jgi:hypothetical protein